MARVSKKMRWACFAHTFHDDQDEPTDQTYIPPHYGEAIYLIGSSEKHRNNVSVCSLPAVEGVQAIIRSAPATLAITMLMWADATIG